MERLTEWQFNQWMAWFAWRNAVAHGEEKPDVPPVKKLTAEETVHYLMAQLNKAN